MKKRTTLLLAGLFVIMATGLIYLYVSREHTAFFDYNKVYNDSAMKQKLEKDLERLVSMRKSQLDSMQLELSFVSQRIQSGSVKDAATLGKFEDDKSRYMTYQQQFEEENSRLKETYFNQIRKDINDKAVLFAKEQNYTFLFAAMGDGALMYADEKRDVTKAFQEYVNR